MFFKEGWRTMTLKRMTVPLLIHCLSPAWHFHPRALKCGDATGGDEATPWPPRRYTDEKMRADSTVHALGPHLGASWKAMTQEKPSQVTENELESEGGP